MELHLYRPFLGGLLSLQIHFINLEITFMLTIGVNMQNELLSAFISEIK